MTFLQDGVPAGPAFEQQVDMKLLCDLPTVEPNPARSASIPPATAIATAFPADHPTGASPVTALRTKCPLLAATGSGIPASAALTGALVTVGGIGLILLAARRRRDTRTH